MQSGAVLASAVRRAHLRSGLAALAVAGVPVFAGWLTARWTPSTGAFLVFGIAITLAAAICARLATGEFDVFEPIVLFVLAYGVIFVVRPIAILVEQRFAYGAIDVSATFDRALLLGLLGAIGFVLGYMSTLGLRIARAAPRPAGGIDFSSSVTGALAVAVAGVASFALVLLLNGPSATLALMLAGRSEPLESLTRQTSKYLLFGSWLLIPATLALLALGRRFRSTRATAGAVVLACLILLRAVPTGNRMMLLPLVVGALVFAYVSRERQPRLLTVAAVVVVSLVLSATFLSMRNATDREAVGLAGAVRMVVAEPDRAVAPLTAGDDAAMAPLLAAALRVIPDEMPHTYGRTIVMDLLVRPIPRTFWPSKPVAPRERLIGVFWPGDTSRRPEFSVLLYPYLDFGYLGVALFMFLFGSAARAAYAYFCMHRQVLAVQILYSASIAYVVIGVRDSPTDTLARAAFVLLPLWVILRLSARRAGRA
jgi:hypothetical protein